MFAAISIPDFSLQAVLRHEPDLRSRPVALMDPELPESGIIQMTTFAGNAGVTHGLTASQGMARCANLLIKPRSRAQETIATEVLLQTAYAFSAGIEDTALGVCTMDLKGLPVLTAHDRCSEEGQACKAPLQLWAENILRTLSGFGLDARIGIAPGPELALLTAHQDNPVSIVQDANEFVSDLPVGALAPTAEVSRVLAHWGVCTAGKFLALGKMEIAERLGPPALEIFDRVSTTAVRPLKLISPSETFSERMEFENAIETADPLLFVLRRFVEQLARRVEAVYFAVAGFHFQLGLSSGHKYERLFKIPSPTANIRILFRMLQTHLETVRTDSPITSLQLSAIPARPEMHQFGLFESTLRDPNQFAETLARLTALVGAENVGTPVVEATHKPDSFRMAVSQFDKTEPGRARVPGAAFDMLPKTLPDSLLTGEEQPIRQRFERNTRTDRPDACAALRRFRPPIAAHFEFRGEKPALIQSKIFTGAITGARGPFVSSGQWWDNDRWSREEWDVETSDGLLLRIFRSNDGWFVEGVYD